MLCLALLMNKYSPNCFSPTFWTLSTITHSTKLERTQTFQCFSMTIKKEKNPFPCPKTKWESHCKTFLYAFFTISLKFKISLSTTTFKIFRSLLPSWCKNTVLLAVTSILLLIFTKSPKLYCLNILHIHGINTSSHRKNLNIFIKKI